MGNGSVAKYAPDATASMVDQSGSDGASSTDPSDTPESGASRPVESTEWLTAPVIRAALGVLGVVLLLYALGRAVGVDLLGVLLDALATRVGRWLLVALFAVLLILVAVRGFEMPAE